jgi:predicted nucleic acid-binding protein
VYIPKTVYEEALAKDSEDNEILEKYLKDKVWIGEIIAKIQNPKYPRNQGEYDCINLCYTLEMNENILDDFQILIDDREGKKLAEMEDIPCIGTITLLRKAIHKGIWRDYEDIQKAIEIIEKSVNSKNGLRIPVKLLRENLNNAIKDKKIKVKEHLLYEQESTMSSVEEVDGSVQGKAGRSR